MISVDSIEPWKTLTPKVEFLAFARGEDWMVVFTSSVLVFIACVPVLVFEVKKIIVEMKIRITSMVTLGRLRAIVCESSQRCD